LLLATACADGSGDEPADGGGQGDGLVTDAAAEPDTTAVAETAQDAPDLAEPDAGPCGGDVCECVQASDCADKNGGDLCKGQWTCDTSTHTCVLDAGTIVTCPDDTVCAKDKCDPGTGKCGLLPRPDGTECDDGVTCTVGDACKAGKCAGGVSSCTCTKQSDCDALDDGDPCNGTLYCHKGAVPWSCKTNPGTVIKCSDSNDTACRKMQCDPSTAKCAMVDLPESVTCEWDGNACTDDRCKAGWCAPGKLAAGKDCKCQTHADCQAFEDGNACNGTLFCNKVTLECALNPASIVTCPSAADEACAANTCDPATGTCAVKNSPDGKKCDDATPCTGGEHCDSGACVAATLTCACTATADCVAVDDDDTCNGALYCDLGKGKCVTNPATVVACDKAEPLACTTPTCQPKTGQCLPAPVPDFEVCEADGTACTGVDHCIAGKCKAGPQVCGCQLAADCAKLDIDGPCDGTLFCDKAHGICVLNPTTKVTCTGGTACKPSKCDPKTGKCALIDAADGSACDADDFVCTADTCAAGACKAGPNQCLCNADAECAGFEDGDLCNGKLHCDKTGAKGVCTVDGKSVVSCTQVGAKACVKKVCNPGTGACIGAPTDQGKACDDGEVCTVGDLCNLGLCTGNDAKTGASCSDSSVCTVGDACNGGVCLPGAATKCDDGLACTKDSCEANKGCVFSPDDTPCDDGVVCTVDACASAGAKLDAKGCAYVPFDTKCGGGGACGVPRCLADKGCTVVPDPGKCSDGIACTVDNCDLTNGCSVVGDDKLCDDKLSCTTDVCNEASGCVHTTKDSACNDGSSCTVDSCDGKKGCVFAADDKLACSDGDVCTSGDACKAGVCKTSSQVDCDDGNPCTDDSCDKVKGCTNKANTKACDDGNPCTDKDVCGAGQCSPGKPTDCADKHACTLDSCDTKTGCVHVPQNTKCDDGLPCTDNGCKAANGCVFTPKSAGAIVPCYSGPAGTEGIGVCVGGGATCDGKGAAGPCSGEVKPGAKDDCGGGDENCNGVQDEDCVQVTYQSLCGTGQTGRPGATLPVGFVVKVSNTKTGAALVGVKLNWKSTDGGNFATAQTTSDSAGVSTNFFELGTTAGKTYIGTVSVDGTSGSKKFTASASSSAPDYAINHNKFCDLSRLKKTGKASAFITNRVQLVAGGDWKGANRTEGAVWSTVQLKKDTSFEYRIDTSGFTAGYSLVVHSTNAGTGQIAGGYADQNTPFLKNALVAHIRGGKGGGAVGAPTLQLGIDGTVVKKVTSVLPLNQNHQAKSAWLTYDKNSKTVRFYIANAGAPRPGTPKATVTADLWKVLGANGKPVYAGVTAANSSAGVNGTKLLDAMAFAYK